MPRFELSLFLFLSLPSPPIRRDRLLTGNLLFSLRRNKFPSGPVSTRSALPRPLACALALRSIHEFARANSLARVSRSRKIAAGHHAAFPRARDNADSQKLSRPIGVANEIIINGGTSNATDVDFESTESSGNQGRLRTGGEGSGTPMTRNSTSADFQVLRIDVNRLAVLLRHLHNLLCQRINIHFARGTSELKSTDIFSNILDETLRVSSQCPNDTNRPEISNSTTSAAHCRSR